MHRIGQATRQRDLRGRDVGRDQHMARQHLGRLDSLHLDDVIAEFGLDWIGDFPRSQPERHVLELLDHRAAAEPPQLATLLP